MKARTPSSNAAAAVSRARTRKKDVAAGSGAALQGQADAQHQPEIHASDVQAVAAEKDDQTAAPAESPMRVHPAADLFPMLPGDELQALAEDIRANGLAVPVVIDAENRIVDGRNRLAACKLAGVEPRFEQLGARDPLTYIFSMNISRRHLTKGQAAMAAAFLFPEGIKGKKRSSETEHFSRVRLSQARSVLRHSRELAASVLSGVTPLDTALKTVEEERRQAEGDEARMGRLRKSAPDLADLVTEERMTLGEAVAALAERETRLRNTYQAGLNAAERLTDFCGHVVTILEGDDARVKLAASPIQIAPGTVEKVADALTILKKFCVRKE